MITYQQRLYNNLTADRWSNVQRRGNSIKQKIVLQQWKAL